MSRTAKGNGRPAPGPPVTHSWLFKDGSNRERMLDMDRRLRPVRMRTLLVVGGALLAAAPWVGWWTLAPLLAAAALFQLAGPRIDAAARPEYWTFASWAGVEAILATSLALTGDSALSLLSLLAVPVVTLSARFSARGIWAGVALALGLMVAVALGIDAEAVAADPPLLIAPAAVAIAIAMLSTALMRSDVEHRGKATLDPLTDLLNRSSLDARVEEVEAQSRITREPVGVVVLDLDGFKEINDSRGHAVGDGVLTEVAYRLRKELRSYDLIYRLGGDEFLILVPGAEINDARVVGLTASMSVANVELERGLHVTASCGVSASTPGEPFDFATVLANADQALYRAKAGDGFASQDSGQVETFGATLR